MRPRSILLSAGLLCLIVLALSSRGAVSQAAQSQPAAIRLQATTFTPAAGESPNVPPGLTISGYAQGTRGYYIVQFAGPVQEAWKSQLSAAGADLLGYIPDFAYKVRMNPAQAARVSDLESVAWVGLFQPAYKISPGVNLDGLNLLRVQIERGADAGQATAAIARSGATILDRSDTLLLVGASADQLRDIAHELDVAWMEPYVLPEKHNEYGAGVIVGANTANASGYDGSTQIAAVSDTGLGDGTAGGAHPDIPASRIVSIYNWPGVATGCFTGITDDGALDVDSGHGTHTAASVLSDGGANGEGKGTAPAASLVFQATENWATVSNFCQLFGGYPPAGYFLTGLPDDLRDMYQQAYNDGARIHSNSWGSAQAGVYTLDSANTDDFIWNNPDMMITFSAGNDGQDSVSPLGEVDDDSIGSPATAKNVLTVGASENDRADNWPCDTNLTYTSHDAYQAGQTCGTMGGQNILGTAGPRWGFTNEPLNSDLTAGNAEQMAPFSSRGPTDDGRIKPDVVAPGTWILSGFSGLYREGYGDPVNPQNGIYQYDGWGIPFNADYKYMGGTSMSNPIAAGAATVVRDYYQKLHAHSASAALVKATLINSAVDLLDENNDGADDNDYPIPNNHEGWGRVNLADATDGNRQFVNEATGLGTGGSATYQYEISTAGSPFKVTLVWSDFPSTEAAAQNLVNDLNLVVTAPDGATSYLGNAFSGGWSDTGGSADNVNNVENVYVQSAAAGTWTVQVSGANVPNGPQPFALVVDGVFGTVDNPPTVTLTNPSPGSTVSGSVAVSADASDDNSVTQVEFFVDGLSIGVDTSAPYETSWDSTTVGDGGHSITATATDSIGQTTDDSVNVTVDNVNDLPVASFSYTCGGLDCEFDATDSFDPDGTIASYAWDFGDGNAGSGVLVNHTYTTANTYTVILTVTDNDGADGTQSQDVSVSEAATGMHVGDLDGSSTNSGRNWQATVTITIHDQSESPVSGVDVSGVWSGDTTGEGACTTDSSGTCSIESALIPKKGTNSAILSVTGASHATLTYDETGNHDPDGDSSGTAIQVNKDGTTEDPGALPNQPPTASFTYTCDDPTLTCSFDASGSYDPDGSVVGYDWDFGDGGTGSGVTPSHTYALAGVYTVVLTVTDDADETSTDSQNVPVDQSGSNISLSASGYKEKGVQYVDLNWSGATTTNVDIYRDGWLLRLRGLRRRQYYNLL